MASNGQRHNTNSDTDYVPPVGPMGLMKEGPGLGGRNCGNTGTQGMTSCSGSGESGRPGLMGGKNHGNCGSQR